MSSAQFIPVIFPDHADNPIGPYTVPLGHAGFILVKSDGASRYYEFGLYNKGENDRLTFNDDGVLGNIRGISLPNVIVGSSGQVDATSLETALNALTSGPLPLYTSDTGMLFASPFAITDVQYQDINTAIQTGITSNSFGAYNATNLVNPNDCISFVYSMAAQGSLNIGPNLQIPPIDWHALLTANPIGFQYYGPYSWNANNIVQVDSSSYNNSNEEFDRHITTFESNANDFFQLSTFINSTASAVYNTINTDINNAGAWVENSFQVLLNGATQEIDNLKDGTEQLIATAGQSLNSLLKLTFSTGGTLQESMEFFASGAQTLSIYGSSGALVESVANSADGTSQITTYDANGNSITTNYSGANGAGAQGSQTITVTSGSLSATVQISASVLNFPTVRANASGFYNQNINLSYVGGNTSASVSDPFTFTYAQDFYLGFPSGATIGTGSVPATAALLVTSGHGILSGGTVTAQIPVTVKVGPLGTSVTTNVTANQIIYSPASPTVSIAGVATNFYDFGTVHVGDTVSVNVAVSNAASATLSDSLLIDPTLASGPFSASGGQETIQAGSSQTFLVSLDASQSGSFFNGGSVTAASHDSALADQTLSALGFNFAASVNSYASPTFTENDGIGTVVQNGSNWSVNLGNIAPINDTETLLIGVQNANQFLTDSLAGSFDMSGNGFSVSGADPFTYGTTMFVNVDESAVGQNTETIVLHPLSQNSTGFSGTLPDQTLTITDTVLCYSAGTRIATARGEVPIEQLAEGDLALTHRGELVPVQWIGRRHINCRRHPKPEKVWPLRVAAGAFGETLPHSDLWLSPDHAVYVDDVLIPIKHLINGTSIAQVPTDQVTYYHIELPHHDVLLAEGLPAESYLDTGDRSRLANGGQPIMLHPDFSARTWEAMGCAPLIVTGPHLAAARRRLNARAAAMPMCSGAQWLRLNPQSVRRTHNR
jgi:hypothetical protein